jgi:hypothetical protein
MTNPPDSRQLRLYVNANDRIRGKPLFQAIVELARSIGMAGASVFPAEFGYGTHKRIHDASSDYEFAEVPVVVELVDAPARIDAFLDAIGQMVSEGLATVKPVRVLRYSHTEAVCEGG